MRRRFGVEAATYLAEPLLAGIHAGDVDTLSVRALFPRFTDAERRHGSLLKAFRRQPAAPPVHGPFRSLPGGMGELTDALVAALPASSIRLRTAATSIVRDPLGGFIVNPGSSEAIQARALILCTPAFVTARLLQGDGR